jgi:hypothetical protein
MAPYRAFDFSIEANKTIDSWVCKFFLIDFIKSNIFSLLRHFYHKIIGSLEELMVPAVKDWCDCDFNRSSIYDKDL